MVAKDDPSSPFSGFLCRMRQLSIDLGRSKCYYFNKRAAHSPARLTMNEVLTMNFDDLITKVKSLGRQKLAVAAAEDDAVLEAVDAAHKQGIADAILVGDEEKIRAIAAELNIDLSDYEIINEPDKVAASLKAVKLAHDGVASMYMKGLLDTKTFLKSVLDKEVGLRTGKTLSHVAVFEVKGIEQLLFLTDVAFMTYPTLEDKVHIIENTV